MRRKIEQEGWQLVVQGHRWGGLGGAWAWRGREAGVGRAAPASLFWSLQPAQDALPRLGPCGAVPCSLGAGAAALVSLKLRESFPGLKCLAFSCPGGLVSKNLAHAMRRFTTTGGWGGVGGAMCSIALIDSWRCFGLCWLLPPPTHMRPPCRLRPPCAPPPAVVVGKDAVPRATVSNLSRLMDEMVTALARCKQPKLKVGSRVQGVAGSKACGMAGCQCPLTFCTAAAP